MLKTFLVICAWAAVFHFGSPHILGLAIRLYSSISTSLGQQPSQHSITALVILSVFILMVSGPVGLVLGLFGLLPGTQEGPRLRSALIEIFKFIAPIVGCIFSLYKFAIIFIQASGLFKLACAFFLLALLILVFLRLGLG